MRSILIDFGQGKQSQLAWLLVGQIPIRIRCPQQRIECGRRNSQSSMVVRQGPEQKTEPATCY
jgi:hypothetical protein